jgi:hypothetical protein
MPAAGVILAIALLLAGCAPRCPSPNPRSMMCMKPADVIRELQEPMP